MKSAAEIVELIRATRDGSYELGDSEAALMINLYASVAVTAAERAANENVSVAQYDRSQEALAHILGGRS